ncbi:MAG: hypothetical protein JWO37_1508 [Acidimicrobiales bacterium]|jgi:hypothetical protein|nr:hypothetical protein [Acidimicrobiales bacterium]
MRARGDQGAFILLWALLMTGLLAMAAVVIDLGQDRAVRREAQSWADFAGLAAGTNLAGLNSSPAVSDPQTACVDAISSVFRNSGQSPPASTPCGSFPAADSCVNDNSTGQTPTPQTTYDTVSSGGVSVTLTYPVDDATIADPRFASGTGTQDGKRCDRMVVKVSKASVSFFRNFVGGSTPAMTATAVVSGAQAATSHQVAALLLLDRTNCGTLTTSGGGNAQYGVVVQYATNSQPGRIQSDSAGVVGGDGNCTTNNNSTGYVLYGTALPGGGGPSIIAQNAPDGTPGGIGLFSLTAGVDGRTAAVYPGGISPAPSVGSIASRKPVDDYYNDSNKLVGAAISNLYTTLWNGSAFGSTPAGYTTYANCSPADGTVVAGDLFVNCADFQPGNNVQFTGTNFIFAGKVTIANNKVFALPNAHTMYVRGCVASCSGNSNYSVSATGSLLVNTGNGTTQTACTSRAGPGAGGSTTNWAMMATASGPFLVSGHASLCQTFVYMGDVMPERQDTTSYPTTLYACTTDLPCPTTSGTGSGYINVSGGGGDVDWSAPNQLTGAPTASSPYEDLAFWSESSQTSTIKGQGTSRTEGVFFMPNAFGTFTGQASQTQPLNAQFIARGFDISGQGSLFLKPATTDAVPIPVAGTYSLIR